MASLIPVLPLVLLLFTTCYHLSEARFVIVGGSLDAWKVPESSNKTLNHWAETVRFQVGDTLVFKYDTKIDSVLQVTKENYESCKTEKPLKEFKEENTKVKLDVSGPHYFISGATGNCGRGEKLIVVVQSPNHPSVPKPVSSPAPPTPSTPPTSPAAPLPPAPAPAKSSAVGLVGRNGILWASTLVVIGITLV